MRVVSGSIHEILEDLQGRGIGLVEFSGYQRNEGIMANHLLQELSKSVCFHMGDIEGLPPKKPEREFFKIPFPECFFECQIPGIKYGIFMQELGEYSYAVFGFVRNCGWWTLAMLFNIEWPEFSDRPVFTLVAGPKDDPKMEAFGLRIVFCDVVPRFLAALACCNTELLENKPPPKLVKKRQKHRKIPLHSFWTLHIKGNKSLSRNGICGISKSSPRVHLRRGHIRRLSSGDAVWVSPCVVGDKSKGIVSKNYAIGEGVKYG